MRSDDSPARPVAAQTVEDEPEADVRAPRLILVTGLSGSGKSTAAKSLEDLGYHCVDNLPVSLLRVFLRDPLAHVSSQQRIAVVTDVRAPGFAEAIPELLAEIDRTRFETLIVFFEAGEDALLRRFSETRRSHPLAHGERPLVEGIRHEREILADLRGRADLVFDTSDWSVHDVRRELYRALDEGEKRVTMSVSVISFGFKHGIPSGSDLVFDVRFLANPYFVPSLREQTGLDTGVREFLDAQPEFGEIVDRLEDLLLFLLPRYRRENRSYLTVAIGCTGGRHRSVATAERLASRLGEEGWVVRVHHRDAER